MKKFYNIVYIGEEKMIIKKLKKEEFAQSTLDILSCDFGFDGGLSYEYLSAFVNKKLSIDYASYIFLNDIKFARNFKTFGELIDFLEIDEQRARDILLAQEISYKRSVINNKLGWAFIKKTAPENFTRVEDNTPPQKSVHYFYKDEELCLSIAGLSDMSSVELIEENDKTNEILQKLDDI